MTWKMPDDTPRAPKPEKPASLHGLAFADRRDVCEDLSRKLVTDLSTKVHADIRALEGGTADFSMVMLMVGSLVHRLTAAIAVENCRRGDAVRAAVVDSVIESLEDDIKFLRKLKVPAPAPGLPDGAAEMLRALGIDPATAKAVSVGGGLMIFADVPKEKK